jgi:hypothetical protein
VVEGQFLAFSGAEMPIRLRGLRRHSALDSAK